jgi:hypothetical protein
MAAVAPRSVAARRRRVLVEALIVAVLCGSALAACRFATAQINPRLIHTHDLWNVWFDADPSIYYDAMTNRVGVHSGASVHPLMPFLMYPPVFALSRTLRIAKPEAVQMVMSLTAAAWVGVVYALGRVLRCRPMDAALLALLAGSSAGAAFTFVIPELHPIGGVTIVLCLIVAALNRTRVFTTAAHVGVNALSAAATVTNWPLGVLISLQARGVIGAIGVTAAAALLLFVLSLAQRAVFPTATLLLSNATGYAGDARYASESGALSYARVRAAARVVLWHAVVMPEIGARGPSPIRPVGSAAWPYRALSVQESSVVPAASIAGGIAVVLWTTLLAAGVVAWLRHHRGWVVLPAGLAAQCGLYLVFGEETFLYALNWMPFFLALVALALATSLGRYLRIGLVALILSNALNTVQQFRVVTDVLNHPDRYPSFAQKPGQ